MGEEYVSRQPFGEETSSMNYYILTDLISQYTSYAHVNIYLLLLSNLYKINTLAAGTWVIIVFQTVTKKEVTASYCMWHGSCKILADRALLFMHVGYFKLNTQQC